MPEISIRYYTSTVSDTVMSNKSVATLCSKIRFSVSRKHFPPFPQNNVDFAISYTVQTTAPTQN